MLKRMGFGVCAALCLELAVAPAGAMEESDAPDGQSLASLPVETPCEQMPYSILLKVENVQESEGLITVDLHGEDPKTFLKSGSKLARIRVPAVAGETDICVPVDHAGVYAIALYHDRDANLKLKKNWIGIPTEPFGLSNNPKLRLAVPKHKDSAFTVEGPLTPLSITLQKY